MGPKLTRFLLLVCVPALVVVGAGLFWLWGGRYISTENAYVKADIAQVAADVSGRVVEVKVRDHQKVKTGDILVRIDPEPYDIALRKTEAELDQMRSLVESLRAQWREATMELREAESKVVFHDQQLARQKQLALKGVSASARLEEAESNARSARDRVDVIKSKIQRTLTALENDPALPPERHAMVREKQAQRDRAKMDLERSVIRAPVDGVAVNVRLQLGEQIRPQVPMFAIVAASRPWIEANFKETELTHVRPGLRATVILDIYPDVVWQAEVDTISPATGAEFAILPPQNASGNWVKVVQRLPVRIRLIPTGSEPPLRAGMTATVRIDTERERSLAKIFSSGTANASRHPKPGNGSPTPSIK